MTKRDLRKGKSGSFDGTDEEWQEMFLDALFGRGKEDIQFSAHLSKDNSKITLNVQRSIRKEDVTVFPMQFQE